MSEKCNVCGRELVRKDEKIVGACAICMNEVVEHDNKIPAMLDVEFEQLQERLKEREGFIRLQESLLQDKDNQLESTRAENARMREALKAGSEICRAFRYSMDRDVPFPSLDKLNEAIQLQEQFSPTTTDNSKEDVK